MKNLNKPAQLVQKKKLTLEISFSDSKIKGDECNFALFSDCILIYWLYYGTVQYWTVQRQCKITLITQKFWVGKWNFQSQLFFLNYLSRFLQVFHSGLCQLWWFLHGSAKHYHFCLVFSIFPSDSRYLGKPYCNQPVSSRTDFSKKNQIFLPENIFCKY